MTKEEKNEKLSDLMNRLDMISMEIKALDSHYEAGNDSYSLNYAIASVDSATECLSYVWDQELALRNINKA